MAGTIRISRENGFLPALGQGLTVLTTSGVSSLTGTFATISSADLWSITYLGNAVVIVFNGEGPPICRPDFDGNGFLDPDDLADYVSCFFSQPPCAAADFSGDGLVDPDDLADFIGAFFAGCQ